MTAPRSGHDLDVPRTDRGGFERMRHFRVPIGIPGEHFSAIDARKGRSVVTCGHRIGLDPLGAVTPSSSL